MTTAGATLDCAGDREGVAPARPRHRGRLQPDSRRAVALVAASLVVGQLGLRGWVDYRGYFFLDDFAFIGRAARFSLTDLHGYLLQPYIGHLMPGAFAEVWVLTKLWPLNWAAVVTVNLALQLLIDVVFYRLLRELFGTRPAILVPFAVYLFTPITMSAFVWWAAALNQLPQQLAMLTALWCQTRYLRTGRVRVGAYGAAATLFGLLFSEKTLLTIPLVFAYTLLIFASGSFVHRVATVVRAHWRVWLPYLAVGVPYAGYYLLEVPSPTHPSHGGDVLQVYGSAFGHAIAPGLLGGPWSWHLVGVVGALADPGRLLTYSAVAVVLSVVVGTIAWRRNAVYGWLLPFGYAVVAVALLAFSRALAYGPVVGDELRYTTDVAAIAVLGATLAVLRPTGSWQTAPEHLERREWTHEFLAHRVWDDLRAALPRPGPKVGVGAVITLFLLSSTTSTMRFDPHLTHNPARPFLTTLRTDLAREPANVVLYDEEVPPQVVWPLLTPYNRLSYLLRALPHHPHYLVTGRSAASLAIPDDQGHVRPVAIFGPQAVRGPVPGRCGWRLGPIAVRVQLGGSTFPWTWVLRMRYRADADTSGTLRAGQTEVPVEFRRGTHDLYAQVAGAMSSVTFSAFTPEATVCTSDLAVGKPVPVEGTAR